MMTEKISFRKLTLIVFVSVIAAALTLGAFAYEGDWPADIRGIEDEDYGGYTVILHSNDVHGAIEGYAKIAWLRGRFEEMGAEVLLFDAGDFAQGSSEVNIDKGKDAVDLMNNVCYDLAAVGNHEFDYGADRMLEIAGSLDFPVICANLIEGEEPVFPASEMFETASGVKIGVFSLLTPETLTKAGNSRLGSYTFLDGEEMYACAQEQVDSLIAADADIVIALTHLGVNGESLSDGRGSLNVYENTSGIDLIIDGHSHTVMTSGEGGEPIQSTGTKFEYIGVIVISPEGEIDDHYLVSAEDLGCDDGIMSLVHDIDDKVEAAYGKVIGYCETQIDGERETNRTAETNNGDLTADSMIWFAENNLDLSEYELSHLLVLFGGGGLRAGLPVGEVTRKNIYEIHPFGNTVCLVKVSGEELLELMEASTAFVPDLCGGYPQSANIVFTVDCTKEYASGDAYPNSTYHQPYEIRRVTIESVCGQTFDPEAEYTIVTSDFTALGGDTYYLLSTKQKYDTGILLDEVLEQYITQALGGVISEEIYGTPRGDHKMIIEAAESDPQPAELAAESEAPDQDVTVYTVVAGDCLWTIAGEFYGDGLRWTDIYAANIDIIADPSLIYPGQGLVVPAA